MAGLLLTSPITWSSWPDAEGQWVPAVRSEMRRDPWNPAVDFDWHRIRKVWMKSKPAGKSVLVEKSPPNLLRAESILRAFPNSVLVISNRDPYAWLSSVMHRKYRQEIEDPQRRREIITLEVNHWISLSRRQIANMALVRGRGLVTTYESFCASPEIFLQNLSGYCGDLQIDRKSTLKIKDYPVQCIADMNSLQIARLKPEDIAAASEALSNAGPEMEFFGYKVRGESSISEWEFYPPRSSLREEPGG
jgi:hypothetical protein